MRYAVVTLLLLPAALSQPVLDLQDQSVSVVATGIPHAGDMEVDGSGNVFVIQVQSMPGGVNGLMTRIDPAGVVTTNLGAPLAEMGPLLRAQDGFIYYWMNVSAVSTSLCQLFPGGQIATVQTYFGRQVLGIAQDAAGDFYMGSKSTSAVAGIHRRNALTGALTLYHAGIPGQDHREMGFDATGQLQARNVDTLFSVPPSAPAVSFYAANGMGGSGDLTTFDAGHFGHTMAVERSLTGPGAPNNRLIHVTPEGYATRLADLGNVAGGGPTVMCRDLAGTGYYVLVSGTLYHITGPAGVLTLGVPAPGQIQARVDHGPGSAPFILAADSPGISIPIPGWGTFATSLGTGPGWYLLQDGIGVFRTADPLATCPWTFTVSNPTPAGINLTLQAYILDPAATNGLIKISNAVTWGI